MSILLKLENSTNTWQSLEIILKGFILACKKHLRYTVNSVAPSKFWFLIRSPPAIDLRIYPHLRLLRFSLHIEKETIRTFPEYVIDWCSSKCTRMAVQQGSQYWTTRYQPTLRGAERSTLCFDCEYIRLMNMERVIWPIRHRNRNRWRTMWISIYFSTLLTCPFPIIFDSFGYLIHWCTS